MAPPTPPIPAPVTLKRSAAAKPSANADGARGVAARSARLCLAYGRGTRAGDRRALNSFIEKALRNKEIQLLDCGDARRTYGYVADAVNMLWRILLEGTHPVYNVGGASTIIIADLARSSAR